MEPWFQMVLTIISSVLASSGLWAYLTKRSERKDVKTEMLVGLAHDRIMYLGMQYVDRGYVTQDEYENLRTYLYDPYKKLGGNVFRARKTSHLSRSSLTISSHLQKFYYTGMY